MNAKDQEIIERIIYKNSDDVAVSIARSFERLEERLDAAESRIYSRITDIKDKIEEKLPHIDTGNADHPIRQAAIAIIEQVLEKELNKEIEGEEYYRLEDKIVNVINETYNKTS